MAASVSVRKFVAGKYVEMGGMEPEALDSILVPISIAASALGIEQTTVRAHVRQGKLDEVIVDCDGMLVKGVSLGSIQKTLAERKRKVQKLAEEIKPLLWSRAADPIEYGQLMSMVGMSSNNPHHRDMIGRALGCLSEESNSTHKFLISALVVLKGRRLPIEVFFRLAEELGLKKRSMSDERFWNEEMSRIRKGLGIRGNRERDV